METELCWGYLQVETDCLMSIGKETPHESGGHFGEGDL